MTEPMGTSNPGVTDNIHLLPAIPSLNVPSREAGESRYCDLSRYFSLAHSPSMSRLAKLKVWRHACHCETCTYSCKFNDNAIAAVPCLGQGIQVMTGFGRATSRLVRLEDKDSIIPACD